MPRRTGFAPGARRAGALRLLLLLLLAGCAQSVLVDEGAARPRARPPRFRAEGARIPDVSGGTPEALGLQRADGFLWMSPQDADAFGRGWVRVGATFARRAEGAWTTRGAEDALVLRTDHVRLRTNLPWEEARTVARRAEAHALRFMLTYGDVFDLRLPGAALPVVVHARRADFEAALRRLTADPIGWGAWYDARSGRVHLSTEPPARGGLPWLVDLRHEMTHQVLDLARPPWKRGRGFGPGWFWLWEGMALSAETLGDPGAARPAARRRRFDTRRRRGETTPLRDLVRLGPRRFEGRHYDQTAALVRYLLDPARPRLREAVLRLVARLMKRRVDPAALERLLGSRLEDLERDWRATLDR